MKKEERDLLTLLKNELEFLEKDGYIQPPGTSWRPVFVFEDSPICLNHACQADRVSCDNCPLMQLVPPEFKSTVFPCRHIPLNAAGETLDSMYRYADDREVQEAVEKWLKDTIAQMEEERKALRDTPNQGIPSSGGKKGTALHQDAKCANPACPVLFAWCNGGKLFRFRESSDSAIQCGRTDMPIAAPRVKYFWLCERCSHVFTLVYEEHSGVVLRISSPEFAVCQPERGAPAA